MNISDDELRELINNVKKSASDKWKRSHALNKLVRKLLELPGIRKYKHPLYGDAKTDALMYVLENIHIFRPQASTYQVSLVGWINSRIQIEMRRIYAGQHPESKPIAPGNKPHYSLEQSQIEGGESLHNLVSETGMKTPTLGELDNLCQEEAQQKLKTICIELKRIVDLDESGRLRSECLTKNHNCNSQIIIQLHYFSDPPVSFREIASRYEGVTKDAVRKHDERKCKKFLKQKTEDLGYRTDIIEDYE
ncbi:MAG: hypothetical protein AAGA83_05620 [Cyanobacteria bacterium P01_F01_bin.116]